MKNLCQLGYHVKTKSDVTSSSNFILKLICLSVKLHEEVSFNVIKTNKNFLPIFLCLLNKKKGIKNTSIKIIKETQPFSFWKQDIYDTIYLIISNVTVRFNNWQTTFQRDACIVLDRLLKNNQNSNAHEETTFLCTPPQFL